jgi:hypothetical protein
MKLRPDCTKLDKKFGWSAQGYLLPCCWCDLKSTFDGKQGALSELVKEHLHIDKVQSIDEVLDTPEWKNFYKVITNDKTTNETPEVCIRHCGQGMRSIRVKEND